MVEEHEVKRTKGASWKSVYETLRNEILSLVLQPGQLLDETTLAEDLTCHDRQCARL